MLSMLIAYDADGNVVATLDYLVVYENTPERRPIGLVDFGAHEDGGGEMTEVWHHPKAKGSKVWPEWLGPQARAFRVELEGEPGRKRIAALVHKRSGRRRTRAAVDREVGRRVKRSRREAHERGVALRKQLIADGVQRAAVRHVTDPEPEPTDLRDVLGGPERPLLLDAAGRTTQRPEPPESTLPLVVVPRN